MQTILDRIKMAYLILVGDFNPQTLPESIFTDRQAVLEYIDVNVFKLDTSVPPIEQPLTLHASLRSWESAKKRILRYERL